MLKGCGPRENENSGSSMRRIVVSLLKGGVAKTETAVHLAHGMARAGRKVLLVDTDVQAQCSDMLGVRPERGLAELVAGWSDPMETLVQARDNLWLLAGGNALAGVKMEIARREMAPEAVLAEALACYEGRFDVMIMDTGPGWDTLLVNALYCCRLVLSPVSMEPMALSGLLRFEDRLAVIQKYQPDLVLRWIVPTFVDGRVKKSKEVLARLEERYGGMITPPIKYSVKLSEATAFGKTIFEHDPRGPGAKSYQALVDRIIADCSDEKLIAQGRAGSAVQGSPMDCSMLDELRAALAKGTAAEAQEGQAGPMPDDDAEMEPMAVPETPVPAESPPIMAAAESEYAAGAGIAEAEPVLQPLAVKNLEARAAKAFLRKRLAETPLENAKTGGNAHGAVPAKEPSAPGPVRRGLKERLGQGGESNAIVLHAAIRRLRDRLVKDGKLQG